MTLNISPISGGGISVFIIQQPTDLYKELQKTCCTIKIPFYEETRSKAKLEVSWLKLS